MSYFNSLVFDTNNYEIVTETLFYIPKSGNNTSFINENSSWILNQLPFQERAFQETVPEKMIKIAPGKINIKKVKNRRGRKIKKIDKGKGKIKKCFLKLLKGKGKKGKKGLHNYMMPLIFGLVLAKSLLIPIILKALTFISAKGLMLGFFSTILASILSLKGMFGSHGYQQRIDDANTQVEIIRLPKAEHYHNDIYRRRDFIPVYKRISYN